MDYLGSNIDVRPNLLLLSGLLLQVGDGRAAISATPVGSTRFVKVEGRVVVRAVPSLQRVRR